jgi:hypothetical protein
MSALLGAGAGEGYFRQTAVGPIVGLGAGYPLTLSRVLAGRMSRLSSPAPPEGEGGSDAVANRLARLDQHLDAPHPSSGVLDGEERLVSAAGG